MKWIRGRRPSPAMIVAVVALFVSLSGVSYGVATGFIDSREIKNNEVRSLDIRNNTIRTRDLRNNEVRGIDIRNSTIQGRDVALNTLTGDDVAETTLGKVPSATSADTAANAANATSVGGVALRRVEYEGEMGGPFVEILDAGGLRLEARCLAGGALEVRAATTTPNSEISSDFTGAVDDSDLDPGETAFVAAGPDDATGQIAFAAGGDGGIVTVQALSRQDLNGVRGSTNDCGFFGLAATG